MRIIQNTVHSFGPRIMLLFDLLLGVSYEKACPMKTIDDDTIEYEGNAYSLLGIYDKIMNLSRSKS